MNLRLPLLSLTLLLGTLAACKKDDPATTADPRDAYVGRWIEVSSNGVPATGSRLDTMTISKSTSSTAALSVGTLLRSGPFTASPAPTGGYRADNTPINTGTVLDAPGVGRANVMLDNAAFALVSGQLSATLNYSARVGSFSATQQYVEVLVRK
jgi:hypothetical protein